jgi:cell division protein FtsN
MEIKTKNKTLSTVLIIVAALVIVGILTWVIIDFVVPRFRPAQEPEVPAVVDTLPAIDSTAIADTIVAEPEPVIVEEPVDPTSKHYHLIAGSFQVESNATRFQQDMQSRGYNAVIITRYDGFHYVSIKQFDSRSEAIAEWRNMTIENPNLWILIK